MAKVLVLYYSSYGHIEQLAQAVAEGVKEAGADVDIKRVPELVPEEVRKASHYKMDQAAPVAQVDDLVNYDAIIFGTPTRFGNMAAQMRNFLDQTGGIWVGGKLVGKIGSVFTSTATGAGNETTITSFHSTLLHHGMIIVGVPYTCEILNDISEARGGGPYGAGTLAGGQGQRQPSEKELGIARFQGRHVASIAQKLAG